MSRKFIIPVLLVLMLFFAGCASTSDGGQQQAPQQGGSDSGSGQQPPSPPQTGGIGGQVTGQGEEVPSIGGNITAPLPPSSDSACEVGFQLSSSNVYLVKVNFASPVGGLVSVQCPNGSEGVDKGGNLFLCEKLTSGSTVTAFLSGERCGSASFNSGSDAPSTPPAQGPVSRCSLSVSPSSIYAGGEVLVDISASTPTGSSVVLDCAGNQKPIESGVVEKSTSCAFNSAGTSRIALYVDSSECANASVTVLPKEVTTAPSAAPSCSVETTKKDSMTMRYEGKVTYSGFKDGSVLKWDCYGAVFSQRLGASGLIGEKGVSGSINIYCQYSQPPAVSSAPVTIDDVSCGSLEVQ